MEEALNLIFNLTGPRFLSHFTKGSPGVRASGVYDMPVDSESQSAVSRREIWISAGNDLLASC